MKPREKLLLILSIAVILLWRGMPIYTALFVTPVDEANIALQDAEEKVQEKRLAEQNLRRSRTNLAKWISISLPSDFRNAQRLYVEWLTDLAKTTGFSEPKVTHTTPRPGRVYTPIRATLEAKVGYDQLCRFLDRFHKADLLHRVAEMTIKKLEEGGGTRLNVTITVEALALSSADKRDNLLPYTTLADEVSRDAKELTVASAASFPAKQEFLARAGNEILLVKSIDGSKLIVERGADSSSAEGHAKGSAIELFHTIPKAKPNVPPELAVNDVATHNLFAKPSALGPADPFETDYAKNTYLRSLIGVGDKWEGWLYNPSNEKTILHDGSTFQIADLTVTVVELNDDHIIVDTGKEKRELRLGANLQTMGKKGDADRFRDRPGRRGGGDSNSEGRGRGGRRGGRRGGGGRGFPDMNDPAVREKMMEFRKKMQEARERGETPDFGDFGGFGGFGRGGDDSGDDSSNEKSSTQSDSNATPEASESSTSDKK